MAEGSVGALERMAALAEQAWTQGEAGLAANAAGAVVLAEHLGATRYHHAGRMLALLDAVGFDGVLPGPAGLPALAGAAVAHDYGALPSWPAADVTQLRDLARLAPADVALAVGCALGEVCERNGLAAEFASLHAQLAAVCAQPEASACWRGLWAITSAWQLSSRGHVDAARAELGAAQALAVAHGLVDLGANIGLQRARLIVSRQDARAALDLAQQALQGVDPVKAPLRFADAADVRARVALRAQDFHAAIAHARSAVGFAEAAGVWPGYCVTYLASEAAALLGTGDYAQAEACYSRMFEMLPPRYLGERALVLRDLAALAECDQQGRWNAQPLGLLASLIGRLRVLEWYAVLPGLPDLLARLLAKALAEGIEVDWVRAAIRFRGLKAPPDAPANWPWPVRVRVLGGFELLLAPGAEVEREAPARKAPGKPLELLRCLAARGHAAQPIDEVAEALWPGEAREGRRKAFEITLGRLRRHLGSSEAVIVHDRRVHLNAQTVWVDLAALLHLLDLADAAETGEARRTRLDAALQLYRGACLAGDREAWSTRACEATRLRLAASLRRAASLGAAMADTGWARQRALAADDGLLPLLD